MIDWLIDSEGDQKGEKKLQVRILRKLKVSLKKYKNFPQEQEKTKETQATAKTSGKGRFCFGLFSLPISKMFYVTRLRHFNVARRCNNIYKTTPSPLRGNTRL